jgi:hypothetical protein
MPLVNIPINIPLNININPQTNAAAGLNLGVSVFGNVGNQTLGQAQGNSNITNQSGILSNLLN